MRRAATRRSRVFGVASKVQMEMLEQRKDELMAVAAHNRDNVTAFIENRSIFGDLIDQPLFVEAYREALTSLHTVGALETVRRFC